MKKAMIVMAALVLCGLAASKIMIRFRQERADADYVMYADWAEVRQSARRLQLSDRELFRKLKASGLGGVLIGVSSVD